MSHELVRLLELYLGFWTTVIVNCMHPANMPYCIRLDQWLIPAIGDVMRAREPYASERRILQSLDPSHGLADRRANP